MNKYDKGFIYLYRQFKNWRYYKNDNIKSVFIHCLLSAYWKDETITEYKGKSIDPPIEIKRGSFITSYKKIAKDLEKNVNSVRYALRKLSTPQVAHSDSTQSCTQEITLVSTHLYTVVTINNFNSFQPFINELAHSEIESMHTDEHMLLPQQLNNINTKEDKKDIKDKKDKSTFVHSSNLNSLTIKLLKSGYITDEDVPEVFDEMFQEFLDTYDYNHINVVLSYILRKTKNKNINHKYSYLKKSLLINLEKMNNLMNDDKKQTDEDEPIIECDEDKLMDLLNKLEKGELT